MQPHRAHSTAKVKVWSNMLMSVSWGTMDLTGFKAEWQAEMYFFGNAFNKRMPGYLIGCDKILKIVQYFQGRLSDKKGFSCGKGCKLFY